MPPLSMDNTPFAFFMSPWLGCALALCLTACNTHGGGSDPAEREPVSQTSESDDEAKPDSRTDADDDKSTNDETQSADSHDSEEDEEDVMPVARSCRTLDDCAEGQVCVLKRGDGFCELGVAEARGPLGQPPPPVGLMEGGLSLDGEGAK